MSASVVMCQSSWEGFSNIFVLFTNYFLFSLETSVSMEKTAAHVIYLLDVFFFLGSAQLGY